MSVSLLVNNLINISHILISRKTTSNTKYDEVNYVLITKQEG